MILCTVGTHEDPFDRLVGRLDALRASGAIAEEVVIQSGYSTVDTPHCRASAMLPFDELQRLMREARIVITHGGPASIMQVLAVGKVPIVVPRQSRFSEHVDDHQVRFAARLADRVLVVLDIDELEGAIATYSTRIAALADRSLPTDRARAFAEKLDALCTELVGRRGGRRVA